MQKNYMTIDEQINFLKTHVIVTIIGKIVNFLGISEEKDQGRRKFGHIKEKFLESRNTARKSSRNPIQDARSDKQDKS